LPGATPRARPVLNPTEATPGVPELQLEAVVLSWVVPSLNVSIAVYCWFPVTGIEAVAGVNVKPFDVAAFTVKVAVAVLPPKVAVMSDVPGATPVAEPVCNPTVATARVPEPQALRAFAVTSMDGPKLKVAIAVNCWVVPAGIEAVAGITASDTNVAAFTVNVAVAVLVMPPAV